MSDDELAALTGPIGLGPDEKVPNQLRILAATQNLGRLVSVHRPTSWLGRIQFRQGRYFVFDQGLVLDQRNGTRLKLFRVGAMRIKNPNDRVFLLTGPQGQAGCVIAQWSDGELLAKALTGWALTHPWS